MGRCLYAVLSGRIDRLSAAEKRSLFGGVDTQGGYLLSPGLSLQLIDLARSASVAVAAGALTLPMEGSELALVKVTGDATPAWRAEGVSVSSSNITLGRMTLRLRTLAVRVPISYELLEDAANAPAVIEQVLRAKLSAELDKAILIGAGGVDPLGLQNTSGINSVTSFGTPSDYSKYSSAVEKIFTANFQGQPNALAWIGHPRDFAKLDVLEDSTGQPLNATPWTAALRRFATTSIPTTLGGGTESLAFLGDFSQVLIGTKPSGVQIRVLDAGTTDAEGNPDAADSLQRVIVAHLRADVAVMQPGWFTLCSGVTVS